jgi:hypothetical protein
MTVRRKRSISLDPDLDARIEASAKAEGVPFSTWLARSAEDRLLLADGLAAMVEWQAEHGEFTAAERAGARRRIEQIAKTSAAPPARRRRTA